MVDFIIVTNEQGVVTTLRYACQWSGSQRHTSGITEAYAPCLNNKKNLPLCIVYSTIVAYCENNPQCHAYAKRRNVSLVDSMAQRLALQKL